MRAFPARWKNVHAVVIGGDIGTYSIARAFYQATGNQPTVISGIRGGNVAHSNILRLIVEPQLEDHDVLAAHLHAIAADLPQATHIFALASADWNVQSLVALKGRLPSRYVVPYPTADQIARVGDKAAFSQMCERLDIPHPASKVRATGEKPSGLRYPIVAKACDTPAFHRVEFAGQKKVFFFADEQQAEAALRRSDAAGYDGGYLLQEYIPGPDSQMRVLNVYAQAGRMVFAGLGEVLLEEHVPSAIGNSAGIITAYDEEILAAAAKILRELNWHGFGCFDIKIDPRSGEPMIFEMNARLGRAHHYLTAAGANPATYYLRDFVDGEQIEELELVEPGHLYTVVPLSLLATYVPSRRKELISLALRGKIASPLFNTAERHPKRWGYALAAMANQWRKYLRHYPPSARGKAQL